MNFDAYSVLDIYPRTPPSTLLEEEDWQVTLMATLQAVSEQIFTESVEGKE